MRRTVLYLLLLPLWATAQTVPQRFEVASVKLAQPSPASRLEFSMGPEYVRLPNVDLFTLIINAYGLTPMQIKGPDWLKGPQGYDVDAKVPGSSATIAEIRPMLQILLAERFKLTTHWETKSLSGYALVVAMDGSKLKASAPNASKSTNFSPATAANRYFRGSMTMDILTRYLQSELGINSPVENHTGIEGFYNIDIAFAGPETMEQSTEASLFTVLQEKLGLKLEPRKIDFKSFVVDHAERIPIEN